MVKTVLIVIIVILMFLPAGVTISPISLASEDTEAYGYAGLMAMLPTKVNPSPTPEPTTDCKCNKSTGKISYDGGTSFTDCPCTGDKNCGCKKTTTSAPTSTEEVFPRTILVTQKKSCVWCRDLDKRVLSMLYNDAHKKSGWRVGKGRNNHVQIIDLDDSDSDAEISALSVEYDSLPTLIFVESNGSRKMHAGSMSYTQFITWAKPMSKKK
jgi:hypothetical protein